MPTQREFDLLLVGDEADQDALDAIARSLRAFGVETEAIGAGLSNLTLSAVEVATEQRTTIALAIGSAGLTSVLGNWAKDVLPQDRPRFAILLPGAPPEAAEALGIAESFRVDLRKRVDDERRIKTFAAMVASLRDAQTGETEASEARSFSELASAEAAQRAGSQSGDQERSDEVLPDWDQFDDGSKAVLATAAAARRADSQHVIHMAHLLVGLYHQDPGPLRQAAAAAGVSETAIRAILEGRDGRPLAWESALGVRRLVRLPQLSSHASQALIAARGVASERGAARIESRHLAAGALSIVDCSSITSLLDAGIDPAQALSWDQPLTPKASAQTDQPTLEDLLGYSSLVDALAELITAPETTFPLTIGISAPWGGGKSSVIRMLDRRLRQLPGARPQDNWVLVYFPAWRYDTGEQLWAAMAKVTFDAAKVGVSWLERLRLRWAVERPRIPAWSTLTRVLFAGVGGVLGYIVGVLVGSLAGPQIEDTAAGVVGGIGGAAAVGRAFWESASDPFKRAVQSIAAQPGISASDGFTPDEERRIRALMGKLLTERAGVVIFIDDLDRCSPRNLVRVIEVVNQIFVASADATAPEAQDNSGLSAGPPAPDALRLVFVMGMDRELVARGIEAEYEPLLARLAKDGDNNGGDFGLAFLEKIIQLWVTLPTPNQAGLDRLLQEAAGIQPAPDPEHDAQIAAIARAMETQIAAIAASDRTRRNAELNRIVAGVPPEQRTAARLARAAVRSTLPPPKIADDPRMWEALKTGADCLEPNPRQRKRFNNAFRLQFYLAQDLSLRREQFAALAKLVAIRLRWPRLANALDEHPDLFRTLERLANGRSRVTDIDGRTAAAQRRRTPEWFDESRFKDLRDLCQILKVDHAEAAISRLPEEDIPRVA